MVRVIIEWYCLPGKQRELEDLLIKLRSQAMQEPGYISGETLRASGDHLLYTVISSWEDKDFWLGWQLSPQRKTITVEIDPLLLKHERATAFEVIARREDQDSPNSGKHGA